ncbi:MAG: transglycosylase SLT domain-containing protein [Deltaproteobacteria bacterium]|nr:transglycosylase SLT domain-containing protein [Deltaproteobacteria bacterium]
MTMIKFHPFCFFVLLFMGWSGSLTAEQLQVTELNFSAEPSFKVAKTNLSGNSHTQPKFLEDAALQLPDPNNNVSIPSEIVNSKELEENETLEDASIQSDIPGDTIIEPPLEETPANSESIKLELQPASEDQQTKSSSEKANHNPIIPNINSQGDDQEILDTIRDISISSNKRVAAFIKLYSVKKREVFEQALERSATYMKMIKRIFKEQGLPSSLAYLAVVESNLNPRARSHANALGLWQFMRYTGYIYGLKNSWWHDDRYDPEKATLAAAQYLKYLHNLFDHDWELALAAYNSGSGTVRRAIRKATRHGKSTDYWSLRLPRETRGYVPAFYAVLTIFNNLEEYGFDSQPELEDWPKKKMVTVPGGISLTQVAKVLNLDYETLQNFNLRLKKGLTPANVETFEIAIPEVTKIDQESLNSLKGDRLKFWKYHRVRKGDSLWRISRIYGIPIQQIIAFNQINRNKVLRIGKKIMLPIPSDWSTVKRKPNVRLANKALKKAPGITYVHKVKQGDTLWKISLKYSIPIKTILKWNLRISRRRPLQIGTEITLKLPLSLTNVKSS